MEIETSYEKCSLKKTKRVVNQYMIQAPEQDKQSLVIFWSLMKQQLFEKNLVVDDMGERRHVGKSEKEVKELVEQATAKREQIEKMLSALVQKIAHIKHIETTIGTDEVTQQDVMMLEEALEMVRQVNEMNRLALEELKKIESVKALGENIRRNSCSLIPKENKMDMD